MSKKNAKPPTQPPGYTPIAQQLTLILPSHLSHPSIDSTLLKHYLKAKLIQKKRVKIGETLLVMIFGREEAVGIGGVKKLVVEGEKEAEGKGDDGIYAISGGKLQVVVTFVKEKQNKGGKQQPKQVSKFYGDSAEYNHFKKIVWQNFKLREQLFQVKLGTIRGIIIGGATGTGKSTFIQHLQHQSSLQQINNHHIHFHRICATQLLSRVVGGAQQHVRKIFKQLLQYEYSIFVIEDMHLLFSQKQISQHETTLATLFSEMDAYPNALIVIGTYNSQRELSRSIYQSGRFQKQIVLNLPNHYQRLQIIRQMVGHLGLQCEMSQEQLKQVNLRLNGFSIGEIKQILRDAYIVKGKGICKEVLLEILKQYRPSEIKELIVEVPEVYWSGIGGYDDVKHEIRKVTEFPLKYPEKFELLGIQPSKGVLLYGPPGCSKTMMAKAIATESKLNFIGIKGPQLFSKYVGQSQRAIRNVFRKARAYSPCIIFFDQIDALATQRNDQNDVTNRLLGQLLTEMDGVQGLKQVVIIAATNRPQILDQALTRPGRFDHLIYVGPPDMQARKQIFQICLKKTPIIGQLQQISTELAGKTQNYTGAQITLLCRQAALSALQANLQNPVVRMENFQHALEKVKSRLTEQSIQRYENYNVRINKSGGSVGGLAGQFGGLGLGSKTGNIFG